MFVHLVCHLVPVPALPMWRGDNSLLSVAWNNGAGKPGRGMQNRDLEGKAEKVGPGQRWELDLAGLINGSGNGRYWKGTSGKRGGSSGSECFPWELCWLTPFPLRPSIMFILVILFFIFHFGSLPPTGSFFLFSFQHPSVFSHHYSCCSSWRSCRWGCSLRHSILTWGRISYPLQNSVPISPLDSCALAARQGGTLLHLLHFQVVYPWILDFLKLEQNPLGTVLCKSVTAAKSCLSVHRMCENCKGQVGT